MSKENYPDIEIDWTEYADGITEDELKRNAEINIEQLLAMDRDTTQDLPAHSRKKLFDLFGQAMQEATDSLAMMFEGFLPENDVQRLRKLLTSGVPLHIGMGIIRNEDERVNRYVIPKT